MSDWEYKTTYGQYDPIERNQITRYQKTNADDPQEPNGGGWEMCGATAAAGALFWFWRRPIQKKRLSRANERH